MPQNAAYTAIPPQRSRVHFRPETGAKVRRRNETAKLFGENFTHGNKNSANYCKAIPPSHIGKSAKACNAVNEEKKYAIFTYIISYTF